MLKKPTMTDRVNQLALSNLRGTIAMALSTYNSQFFINHGTTNLDSYQGIRSLRS